MSFCHWTRKTMSPSLFPVLALLTCKIKTSSTNAEQLKPFQLFMASATKPFQYLLSQSVGSCLKKKNPNILLLCYFMLFNNSMLLSSLFYRQRRWIIELKIRVALGLKSIQLFSKCLSAHNIRSSTARISALQSLYCGGYQFLFY